MVILKDKTKNLIAPTAIIEEGAVIGNNCRIDDFVIIKSNVIIGDNNHFHPYCVIGDDPQDRNFKGENSQVIIGNHNIFREFVTVHRAVGEGQVTRIGDHNYLMVGSHLGHNVKIANYITMANGVTLGGYVEVDDYANFGGKAVVHQHCRIGKYAMLSGLSATNHDALPFMSYVGIPSKAFSTNRVALKRAGFSQARLSEIMRIYKAIYEPRKSIPKIMEALNNLEPSEDLMEVLNFIKLSKRNFIVDRFSSGN